MSKLSLAKAAITGGIRLIKGGAKSYGKIKKAKSISKRGVESALSRAGIPRSLGKVKAKANAFKGVASAGATKAAKVAKTTAKRMPKVNPYGAAAAVGAAGGVALQAKKTPTSVSAGKKKVGYVKSNRSGRGGLRTRGR